MATSKKLAGYLYFWLARLMVMVWSSMGWRNASKTDRGYSKISSKNRTPLCAKLISPGRALGPPPMIETLLAVWCGARNGLDETMLSAKSGLLILCSLVTSIIS